MCPYLENKETCSYGRSFSCCFPLKSHVVFAVACSISTPLPSPEILPYISCVLCSHISLSNFFFPWSLPQPSSAGFIFMKHTATKVSPESGRNCLEARYWTDQLNDYLTALRREKLTLDGLSSKKTSTGWWVYLCLLHTPSIFIFI